MEEIIEPVVLEPAYTALEGSVQNDVLFNIDYYKSHYVPVREIVELKQATHE